MVFSTKDFSKIKLLEPNKIKGFYAYNKDLPYGEKSNGDDILASNGYPIKDILFNVLEAYPDCKSFYIGAGNTVELFK